jgi:uncharacterized membrane protein YkoI
MQTNRTMILRALTLLIVGASIALGGARALAQQMPPDELIEGIVFADGGISLDEAIARVQRQFNARVVRAEVKESSGRVYYVLRLLSEEGRVWTVRVDAATGRVQ